jgi:hypothetical protein
MTTAWLVYYRLSVTSPSLILRPTVSRLVYLWKKTPVCVALSDERTGLSFTVAPGSRQPSHFYVRVSWDSLPYFTLSDSRLPVSSPLTTRKVTIDVSDNSRNPHFCCLWRLDTDRIEKKPFLWCRAIIVVETCFMRSLNLETVVI